MKSSFSAKNILFPVLPLLLSLNTEVKEEKKKSIWDQKASLSVLQPVSLTRECAGLNPL